ncbi:MAG: hypothetical protein H5T92_04980, partial [Synergistales bacterium]|nr:hypothetical protein [Synergistales bacterium]
MTLTAPPVWRNMPLTPVIVAARCGASSMHALLAAGETVPTHKRAASFGVGGDGAEQRAEDEEDETRHEREFSPQGVANFADYGHGGGEPEL